MRKERYKLIGMLSFTILMIIIGFIGFIQDADLEFLFLTVVEGTMPYGYCILSHHKNKNYDGQYANFSYITFLFKFIIGSLIGIFAFIPMLWILISNVKKENEEFSERKVYFTNKIEIDESTISGITNRFSNKYVSVLEKYPECLNDSKNALSLIVKLSQLRNKLIHIQLYEGNVFYSGLVSTVIVRVKFKKVVNQMGKIILKTGNYFEMMSKQDFMEEDDDCLCEWSDELGYYIDSIDRDLQEVEWIIYKHQEMFSFFLKRDLIVLGIVVIFLLCL